MDLKSPAFENMKPIPERHSAYGSNVPPTLQWSDPPQGTKTLALVMDDPDAPRAEPFVHWVVYNIPAGQRNLDGGTAGTSGMNDAGRRGYYGPKPPSGTHRYIFHLYVVDKELSLPEGASKDDLLRELSGHTLGKGELVGTYSAPR